jgi:hypothetical protein
MNSNISRLSIWVIAAGEADEHKWHESMRNNRDMGVEAIRDWYRKYFRQFVRGRLMDHISGKCLFEEFNESAFNILQVFKFKCPQLREKLETSLRDGKENLDIIAKELDKNDDVDEAIRVLEVVNVNLCHTLRPPIEVPAEV